MDFQETPIHDIHDALSTLVEEKGEKNTVIKNYLEKLHSKPIKDFASGLEWFNVSEPLTFSKHLKGKVVVLDFFTYCCINCMHILPELREIEQEFTVEDGLVVIGVHSAKFANEKISDNILAAVQRYNIRHPVVNDHNSEMWKNCDVHCWPTLLILAPDATPIVMLMGEGHKKNLQTYIKASLDYYKSKKQISTHKLPFKSAFHLLPDLKGPLLFPGKITGCSITDHHHHPQQKQQEDDEILAISDTGNHRILIVRSSDGTVLHQIGSGRAGFKDGAFHKCQFSGPQGAVFGDAQTLYVADTDNHAVRKVDLTRKQVQTLCGTGRQGDDRIGGKQWTEQIISSPWDLALYRTPDNDMTFYPDGNPPLREILLIAMAGTHQIWALFLDDIIWWKFKKYPAGTCLCIAGSGREENRNNAYPMSAGFAQPSGLALCNKNKEVYIADSESSSIRRLCLQDGKVTGVVGGDRNPHNLFAFGDKDGSLCEAKLQHALGLAMSKDENILFVADTYNHKLKYVDVSENRITTIQPPKDSTSKELFSFNEPAGLYVSQETGKLYVADTNNHAIKIVDLKSDGTVKLVKKLDLKSPNSDQTDDAKLPVIKTQVLTVNVEGAKIILAVNLNFKQGLKLTEGSPQSWSVRLPDATWSCVPSAGNDLKDIDLVVSAPKSKDGSIDLVFNVITCTEDSCLPKSFVVRIPVKFGANRGKTSLTNKLAVVLSPDDTHVKLS